MPKLKRTSENQLNKDIYDAGEDDRFGEQPDPGRGMTRASQDVLGRRKIVKVSRRKFGVGAPKPSAPPSTAQSSRPPSSAPSANPFASTSLVSASSGPPARPNNPFANVAFASSSTSATTSSSSSSLAAAPAKPSFSFGPPAAAAAPKPAMSAFSFPSSAADATTTTDAIVPKTAATTTTQPSTPRTSSSSSAGRRGDDNDGRIRLLNENFMHTIVGHYEGGMMFQDYTPFLREYREKGERLLLLLEEADDDDDGDGGTARTKDEAGTTTTSNGNSRPDAGSWSFGGAKAPAPAAEPFSMGASSAAAPPAGTFSFAPKPAGGTAGGASSAAPAFSFGGLSSSSSAAAPSAAANNKNNNNDDDDPTSNPDDGKVDKVEQEENADEEVLHEVRAKHIKFENNAWKKYGTGVLRLYRHNVTSKHRMVIRNEIGKVQFNVGVSRGMKFEKVVKDTKRGKNAFVKFYAVEDAGRGMESFMLQVKPESVDKLHETLEGMVA